MLAHDALARAAALADLLAVLRERGITAVVVNLPVTDTFIGYAKGGRSDYDAYVADIRAAADGGHAIWLDAMQTAWPDRFFRDVNHLNDDGVQRLLPMLVDTLRVA